MSALHFPLIASSSEPPFLFFVSIPLLLTVLARFLLPRRGLGRMSGAVMLLFSAIFAAAFILYAVDSDISAARNLKRAAEARAEGFAPAPAAPADMPSAPSHYSFENSEERGF